MLTARPELLLDCSAPPVSSWAHGANYSWANPRTLQLCSGYVYSPTEYNGLFWTTTIWALPISVPSSLSFTNLSINLTCIISSSHHLCKIPGSTGYARELSPLYIKIPMKMFMHASWFQIKCLNEILPVSKIDIFITPGTGCQIGFKLLQITLVSTKSGYVKSSAKLNYHLPKIKPSALIRRSWNHHSPLFYFISNQKHLSIL